MPTDFARCVIQHPDGRWLYHLPTADTYGVIAVLAEHPGAHPTTLPMTRLGEKSSWWSTDSEATRITLLRQQGNLVTGYTLINPDAASVQYPAELTVDEWNARRERASTAERDRLWSLYNSVSVPQDPTEEHIDGPFVVLEGGEPPAPDAPQWTVNLLDAVTQRPEYAHLFPGYIKGLRDHIHRLIERMPGVRFNFNGYQGHPGLHVTLKVPFEQPVTSWQSDIGKRGQTLKSGRNVPVLVERRLILPAPAVAHGNTYAEALTEWNTQVAYWTDQVKSATVAACNHCHGTGHIPAGAEQYDARR